MTKELKSKNKPKRKYEFKSEKNKRIIIKSIVVALLITAIVAEVSTIGCKLYSLNKYNNMQEGTTKNASASNISIYANYGGSYLKFLESSENRLYYNKNKASTYLSININNFQGYYYGYQAYSLEQYDDRGHQVWVKEGKMNCTKITNSKYKISRELIVGRTNSIVKGIVSIYSNSSCKKGGIDIRSSIVYYDNKNPKIKSAKIYNSGYLSVELSDNISLSNYYKNVSYCVVNSNQKLDNCKWKTVKYTGKDTRFMSGRININGNFTKNQKLFVKDAAGNISASEKVK